MAVTNWMSWEGGIDLAAATGSGVATPNIIVHVARMVHTPVGSAPSGMVLYQPNPKAQPEVMGFISTDEKVGLYFGPRIFQGTPFEKARVLKAKIEVHIDLPGSVRAVVSVGKHVFETRLSDLRPAELIHRPPSPMAPFTQQGVEAGAARATLSVNGKDVAIVLPPAGISGGPAAVWAPAGIYAR